MKMRLQAATTTPVDRLKPGPRTRRAYVRWRWTPKCMGAFASRARRRSVGQDAHPLSRLRSERDLPAMACHRLAMDHDLQHHRLGPEEELVPRPELVTQVGGVEIGTQPLR